MNRQHAVKIIASTLHNSDDISAFQRVASLYAGLVVAAVGAVVPDVERFMDEVSDADDDLYRAEKMDRLGLFAGVQRHK